MRDHFDRAWSGFQEKIEEAKDSASDQMRDRMDTELGLFLIKNAGTLLYFDKQIRDYERQIKRLARNGEKDEAIEVAQEMKGYIMYQKEHNRRYKKEMKKVAKKLEGRSEQFAAKMEQAKDSRLLDWVEKLNTMDKEDFEEELGEISDEPT